MDDKFAHISLGSSFSQFLNLNQSIGKSITTSSSSGSSSSTNQQLPETIITQLQNQNVGDDDLIFMVLEKSMDPIGDILSLITQVQHELTPLTPQQLQQVKSASARTNTNVDKMSVLLRTLITLRKRTKTPSTSLTGTAQITVPSNGPISRRYNFYNNYNNII